MKPSGVAERTAAILVATFDPAEIILFGSRAAGSARPDSDVDLLVVLETDLAPSARRSILESALDRSVFSVDVLLLTPAEVARARNDPHSLVSTAMARGRILYRKPVDNKLN